MQHQILFCTTGAALNWSHGKHIWNICTYIISDIIISDSLMHFLYLLRTRMPQHTEVHLLSLDEFLKFHFWGRTLLYNIDLKQPGRVWTELYAGWSTQSRSGNCGSETSLEIIKVGQMGFFLREKKTKQKTPTTYAHKEIVHLHLHFLNCQWFLENSGEPLTTIIFCLPVLYSANLSP